MTARVLTCAMDVSHVAISLAFRSSFAPSCASFGENALVGRTSEDAPSIKLSAPPLARRFSHDDFMMAGRTQSANATSVAPSASSVWLFLDTDSASAIDAGNAIWGSAAVGLTPVRSRRTFFSLA